MNFTLIRVNWPFSGLKSAPDDMRGRRGDALVGAVSVGFASVTETFRPATKKREDVALAPEELVLEGPVLFKEPEPVARGVVVSAPEGLLAGYQALRLEAVDYRL